MSEAKKVGGSSFVELGPVTLGCITPDASELLDDVMASYRKQYDPSHHTSTPDQVYQFAYWLIRWSGLVQRLAIARVDQDERKDGLLWLTCPWCGVRDNTGISTEVTTGIVTCGRCGALSTNDVCEKGVGE